MEYLHKTMKEQYNFNLGEVQSHFGWQSECNYVVMRATFTVMCVYLVGQVHAL